MTPSEAGSNNSAQPTAEIVSKQMVFKHPFLGEIDGIATVSFVGYHELRHYKQIREVIKKLGSSDSPS